MEYFNEKSKCKNFKRSQLKLVTKKYMSLQFFFVDFIYFYIIFGNSFLFGLWEHYSCDLYKKTILIIKKKIEKFKIYFIYIIIVIW